MMDAQSSSTQEPSTSGSVDQNSLLFNLNVNKSVVAVNDESSTHNKTIHKTSKTRNTVSSKKTKKGKADDPSMETKNDNDTQKSKKTRRGRKEVSNLQVYSVKHLREALEDHIADTGLIGISRMPKDLVISLIEHFQSYEAQAAAKKEEHKQKVSELKSKLSFNSKQRDRLPPLKGINRTLATRVLQEDPLPEEDESDDSFVVPDDVEDAELDDEEEEQGVVSDPNEFEDLNHSPQQEDLPSTQPIEEEEIQVASIGVKNRGKKRKTQ
jgi:hypothetical protein